MEVLINYNIEKDAHVKSLAAKKVTASAINSEYLAQIFANVQVAQIARKKTTIMKVLIRKLTIKQVST